MNRAQFAEKIELDGCVIVPEVLDRDFIDRATADLEVAIESEVAWHGTDDYIDYGMVLICSTFGGCFLELFENRALIDRFEWVLGQGCTVYAYTSSSMPPGKTNLSRRIHVDCPRLIPGYVTNLGATILLSDFTEENGATWYLPGSHGQAEEPSADEFERNARRLVAPAGSVLFFNARLWHAGGNNRTDQWRHALTINMARPWMKQRIDLPRAMANMDLSDVPEAVLQKLGFLAQVPASREEYYRSPEKRLWRQKTE